MAKTSTKMSSDALAIITGQVEQRHTWTKAPPVEPDSDLADLGLDQLDISCIACAIEEVGGFKLSDREVAKWRTVADVVASMERRSVDV